MAKQSNKKSTSKPKSTTRPATDSAVYIGGKDAEKATKAYLQNLERAQLEQSDLNDISKELSRTWKDLSIAIEKVSKYQDILNDDVDEYQALIKSIYGNIKNIGTEYFEQLKVQDKLKNVQSARAALETDSVENFDKLKETQDQIKKLSEKQLKLSEIFSKSEKKGNDLTALRALYKLDEIDAELQSLKAQEDLLSAQHEQLETSIAQARAQEDLLEPLSKASELMEKANEKAKEFGVNVDEVTRKISAPFESALGFLDSVPGGGIMKSFLGIDSKLADVSKTVTDSFVTGLATTGSVGSAAFGALTAGAGAFMTVLAPILPILLAIGAAFLAFKALQFAVESALELDKAATDVSNNLNLSKDASRDLSKSLADNNVVIQEQAKYSKILSDNFGTFGKQLVNTLPRLRALQHNLQLSDEAANGITNAAALLNSSLSGTAEKASEFETVALNTTKELYEQQGIELTREELAIEFRQNLEDIGKITKRNLALYGKTGTALIKQVQTIRRLGLEFEQVAKISENVLDIESSIESEMKANVLLGKHLNLNAVRQAALYGNTEDVAKAVTDELSSQNINLDEFNKMMPFQKKVLSQALGLQEDEVQQMLLRNKLGNQQLIEQLRRRDLSEEELKNIKKQMIGKGKLNEAEAAKLILEERRTSIEQDAAEVQAQLTSALKSNMSGLQGLLKGIADIGTRMANGQSLFSAILGDEESDLNLAMKKAAPMPMDSIMPEWLTVLQSKLGMGMYSLPTANTAPEEDFISRSDGTITSFSKGDLVMGVDENSLSRYSTGATATASDSNQNLSATEMIKILSEQNSLLKQLVAKVDQPIKMTIGNRALEEIETQSALRRSYNTRIDGAYGTFG